MHKHHNLDFFEKIGFFIIKHFRKFVYFCLVGFGAFLIDWFFFNAFYRTGIGFILSKISSALISVVFNFGVNRNFTFKARGHSIKKQIIKWMIVYAVSISSSVVTGKIVLNYLGESVLNANIAYFIGIAIAIPISFLGSLLWAFKKK